MSLITKTSISRANYQETIVEEPQDELPYYHIPRQEAPPAPAAAGIFKVSKIIQKIRPRQAGGILCREQRKNKPKLKGKFAASRHVVQLRGHVEGSVKIPTS